MLLPASPEKLEGKTVPVSRAATFHSMFTEVTARQTDRTKETEEIKRQASCFWQVAKKVPTPSWARDTAG